MKSVTEFPVHKLLKGLDQKTKLAAEGKTPEEVATAIGEAFKMEGDKIKFFMAACDVAEQNKEKLARVLVVQLAEGETAPPKSVKVEEHTYVPDFAVEARKPNMEKFNPNANKGKGGRDGGGRGKGAGSGRPKETPWGVIPEQKETKKPAAAAAAATDGGDNKPS